jgi:FtsZ-binding cell division protein ZapB
MEFTTNNKLDADTIEFLSRKVDELKNKNWKLAEENEKLKNEKLKNDREYNE